MKALLNNIAVRFKFFLARLTPVQTLVFGYASYILLIFVPLCIPITWQADHVGWLDHLFMATSAVSTTGLVTINTPDAYNFFGQFILLIGFQIGGLGYMTFGSFAILTPSPNPDPPNLRESSRRMSRKGFLDEEASQSRTDRCPAASGGC